MALDRPGTYVKVALDNIHVAVPRRISVICCDAAYNHLIGQVCIVRFSYSKNHRNSLYFIVLKSSTQFANWI